MKSAGGGGAPCKTVIQKVRKSYLFTIRHAAQYAVIICGMECFFCFFPPRGTSKDTDASARRWLCAECRCI